MEELAVITTLIIIITALISYKGFKDPVFFDHYSFQIDRILIGREYRRLVTSGFLHVGWSHLIFNMISLYLFSSSVELFMGNNGMIWIYAISLVGGNLFTLYIHRNHGDYSAVGASGAVNGVIFASIALFPDIEIGFLFLPVYIPGWLFGLLYVLYSIYGIKTQKDNIGHEAHLGGGIIGLLIAIVFRPEILKINYIPILAIAIPTLAFIFIIIKKPHVLILDNPFRPSQNFETIDTKYNSEKANRQLEIDRILDQISREGYDKLSKKDKEILNNLSE